MSQTCFVANFFIEVFIVFFLVPMCISNLIITVKVLYVNTKQATEAFNQNLS